MGMLLTNVVGLEGTSILSNLIFVLVISSGASALLSLIERSASQSHTEHAEVASPTPSPTAAQLPTTIRTPRSLEMRLAMNNDILGDEDLMSFPGPNLTSILGRDLSTYHRVSGRDIIMNQIITRKDSSSQPSQSSSQNDNRNDQPNSFCQQNNSKMDTPILNRKLQRTWSSSGFARKGEIEIDFVSC